jgi:hypothetical protein
MPDCQAGASDSLFIVLCHSQFSFHVDHFTPFSSGFSTGRVMWATQHEIKLSTRESDVIKRCGKHKMCEAAASVTWHTALQWA